MEKTKPILIRKIDPKGRSLLNCNSFGNYPFSHDSVQEFMVAHRILDDESFNPERPIPVTDVLIRFVFFAPQDKKRLKLLDLKSELLRQVNVTGADLRGVDLATVDLSNIGTGYDQS